MEINFMRRLKNLNLFKALNFCSFSRKDASDIGNYYSEDFVLQHDLLRELAIHQSNQEPIEQRKRLIMNISGNNLPKWTEQKQQPLGARLLSISTGQFIFLTFKHPTRPYTCCDL
jgi:hypothetical protein